MLPEIGLLSLSGFTRISPSCAKNARDEARAAVTFFESRKSSRPQDMIFGKKSSEISISD
jgi:hypothetical protein